MSRSSKLVKNSFVFFIGNFASKLLSFFLLPLYTHYLTNSVYGEFDIFINILAIAYCVVSFQSIEVVYRYVQDCKTEEDFQSVITNSFIISVAGISCFALLMFLLNLLFGFEYWLVFILYTSSNIFAQFCQQCIRGLNRTILYSSVGVLATLAQVLFNVIFIVCLNMGGVSMLWAHVGTFIIICIAILLRCNLLRYITLKAYSPKVVKEQLKYGLPLMPNALCLWGISSLGRYLLLLFYTTAAVGILAFSSKFSLLLGVVNSVFFLAWQQSAISEYNSSDRDEYASSVFDAFVKLQITGICVILPMIKVLIFSIMGSTYQEGWIYVPLFFIGIMFNAFANFVSMGFFGAKQTKSVFYASFLGILVYISVGYFGAKYLYITGVGIAYILSQLVYFIVMKFKGAKYMKVNIHYKSHLGIVWVLICSLVTYYLTNNLFILIGWCITYSLFGLYFNKTLLKKLCGMVVTKVKRN